ncbi:MAG: DUF4082 domain-containing protein, partial [Propionicimonas sp.]|nr:DUF4082 domain-containing protein [Propionicimonas sp.]
MPRPRRAIARPVTRPLAALLALLFAIAGLALWASPEANAASTSLWGSAKPSRSSVQKSHAAVELGTRFTATATGKATGVRFYKTTKMKGKHTGTLWSSSGKKLATVTFTREGRSGWQTASFKTPVTLKAGTTYVVSYHVPRNGGYVVTRDYRSKTSASGLSTTAKKTGVYRYNSKVKFPTSSRSYTQYWVDVVFVPDKRKPTPTPTPTPTVTASPEVQTDAIALDYASRSALVADGWDFLATTAAGAVRNTEQAGTAGITFSEAGLKVPAGEGDLWKGLNNSRNTLFRDLPDNWSAVELGLTFAPTANYQQAGVVLYGDDDNYVQVVRHYQSSQGHQATEFIAEAKGVVLTDDYVQSSATSVRLRLSRADGRITGSISSDGGSNWVKVGSIAHSLDDVRLGITVGGNESGGTSPLATVVDAAVDTPV